MAGIRVSVERAKAHSAWRDGDINNRSGVMGERGFHAGWEAARSHTGHRTAQEIATATLGHEPTNTYDLTTWRLIVEAIETDRAIR